MWWIEWNDRAVRQEQQQEAGWVGDAEADGSSMDVMEDLLVTE